MTPDDIFGIDELLKHAAEEVGPTPRKNHPTKKATQHKPAEHQALGKKRKPTGDTIPRELDIPPESVQPKPLTLREKLRGIASLSAGAATGEFGHSVERFETWPTSYTSPRSDYYYDE